MYILLSPSKSLDFTLTRQKSLGALPKSTLKPYFLPRTKELHKVLAPLMPAEISDLMHISHSLATLNYQRFQSWNARFASQKSDEDGQLSHCAALSVFTGDVYSGFELELYRKSDWNYAERHIGILSGFYGLLSPLTLIKPYRLEMGTRLHVGNYENLYEFWGDTIGEEIIRRAQSASGAGKGESIVLNLASLEYSKAATVAAIQKKSNVRVVNVYFKENRDGILKTIAIFAKKARGEMANMVVRERVKTVDDIRKLKPLGFTFSKKNSTDNDLTYIRMPKSATKV